MNVLDTPTPTVDDLIVKLRGAKRFTKLDLKSAFHQIELSEESRYITAFRSEDRVKRYRRLIFGANNAAEELQHALNIVLSDIDGVTNIADDILIYGTDTVTHDRVLKETLKRLFENGITLNLDKCIFDKESLEYYGYIFLKDGVKRSTTKISALRDAKRPEVDDFSAGGSIINLKHWWDTLCKLGPKFGYFPEASKCWLIIKPEAAEKAHTIFKDTEIQITKRGKRHLGAIIGTDGYRDEYVLDKINQWSSELQLLCEIAKIEPQAAYSCFVSGYKHKLTYYMRTIPGISHLLQCIDDIILTEFIPAITGGIKVNQTERILISLPVKYGGLGIPIFSEVSDQEYSNSLVVTENLCKKIVAQHRQFEHDPERNKKKNKIKNEKKKKFKATLDDLKLEMNTDKIRLNEIHQEIGSSSWLTSLPLKDEGYVVNKQSFWDLIRIRYGWELSRLPETCECGRKFTKEHALSCKKGGFVSLRHNQVRNITAILLKEVCHDVCIEPRLQKLTGESLNERVANTTDEARLDISARGFWTTGQLAFLDVRVFNPIAKRYVDQELSRTYVMNEKEKKKMYNERVMQIEHGSFTPLVMSATGGMGRECHKFYARLSELIADKRKQSYSFVASWVRRKICFALINSVCICIRGSRSIFRSNLEDSLSVDPEVSEITSRIR